MANKQRITTKTKMHRTQVCLPPKLYKEILKISKESEVSMAECIRIAVKNYIEEDRLYEEVKKGNIL